MEEKKEEVKPTFLEEIRKEKEELTKLRDEITEERKKIQELKANEILSGNTDAVKKQEEKKTESPEEYKNRIEDEIKHGRVK